MSNLSNTLRQIFVSLVEDVFDALDEAIANQAPLPESTQSGFDLLDDEDDAESYEDTEYDEDEDEYEDEDPYGWDFEDESYYESEDEGCESMSWPNVGNVSAQGSGANQQQQPTISWPNVSAPPAPKPAVSWPNVSAAPTLAPTPALVNATSTAQLVEVVDCDSRGRACVPAALVQHAGFNIGDIVYVSVRAHKQPGLVLLHNPTQTGHLSAYTVDKDCNIRLSHYVLTQGNLGLYDRIKFQANKDRILVLQG